MKGYTLLLFSILFEIVGTSMLKLSNGFTNIVPTITFIVCFAVSYIVFIQALKTISLSIGYSIWSGLGTVGAGLIGVYFFNEYLSGINFLGLFIVLAGIVLMTLDIKPKSKRQSKAI